MKRNQWSEEELEQWAAKLPTTGPRTVSRPALDRISSGVVARLERKQSRRRLINWIWQPVGVAAITAAVVAFFLVSIPTQNPNRTGSAPDNLLSTFAPEIADSLVDSITEADISEIVAEVVDDKLPSESDLLSQVYAISTDDLYLDVDAAMQKLSQSDRSAILDQLKNDPSLDWSELL